MYVFVTVGSTSFDDLIETLCSDKALTILKSHGFKKIKFQIGRGNFIPVESSILEVEWFRFKDSLENDLKNASLVIGHAGAGTILESLFRNKPLIVVLNERLMNNHQEELAEKLASEGYLKYTSCSRLLDNLESYISKDCFQTCIYRCDDFQEVLEGILSLK